MDRCFLLPLFLALMIVWGPNQEKFSVESSNRCRLCCEGNSKDDRRRTDQVDETAKGEERIDEIIARYLDARQSGSEPSVAEIVARYPEYEKQLREFFQNENSVRDV